MKKIFFYCFTACLVFVSCSKDETIIDNKDKEEIIVNKPIAIEDTYSTLQNTPFLIQDILENDTIFEFARIESFDEETTENGHVESRGNNNYLYTPPSPDFIGTDSFTYTICDNLSPTNCSTTTVFINVDEAINNASATIILRDDSLFGNINTTLSITNLLENDFFQGIEDVNIVSVNDDSSNGTLALLDNNMVSYTPPVGFVGTDTFQYQVCDNSDTENCEVATVTIKIAETISFNIPNEISEYYSDAFFFQDPDLMYESLQTFTENAHTTILQYVQRHDYLYDADEDLENTDNVVLMYSGESRYWEEYASPLNLYSIQTFNTEHVYPQSLLSAADAITDLHHLRVCDESVNTSRSNNAFKDGTGVYGLDNGEWYPGDEWRGDVARMIMYLNLRYGEEFASVGSIDLFLTWNIEDPVSAFEIQRNNVISAVQGNRNPFIDNPYSATLIWGGIDAENKWE